MKEENEKLEKFLYCILGIEQESAYTNVVYKAVFGKNAAQLREEYGVTKKDSLRDCFSEEDLVSVQNVEMCISSLIGFGWGYEQIKGFIEQNSVRKIA